MFNFFKQHKKYILLILVVLVGVLGYMTVSFYQGYMDLKNNPQKATDEENRKIIKKISNLMLLPSGEDPTIATVMDPEKLKEQPFFAKAETGDKVLIYTRAGKAILYNPRKNLIINVAPMNLSMPEDSLPKK